MNQLSNKHRGFTLIELLVVIAIIAILAAILFPVFAQAREKARAISCESNMKQIMLATLMYANDYDEDFPGTIFAKPNGGAQIYTWMVAVQPYVKNGTNSIGYTERGEIEEGGVWSCPDSPLTGFPTYSPATDLMPNYWENTPDSSDANHHAVSIEKVVNPADKILYFDSGANGTLQHTNVGYLSSGWANFNGEQTGTPSKDLYPAAGDPFYKDCDTPAPNDGGWEGCAYFPRFRHTGMDNVAYTDGHVKAMHKYQFNWYVNTYNAPTFNAYAPGCGVECAQGF